uniref:Uncharacterized protein n=1 Tax=Nothobranchius furzeri TaxID=105023 RepID=A0A8C6NMC6_NOTFU
MRLPGRPPVSHQYFIFTTLRHGGGSIMWFCLSSTGPFTLVKGSRVVGSIAKHIRVKNVSLFCRNIIKCLLFLF